MHGHEAATVSEHGFDLHRRNEIGDAIHDISLGQGCAGLVGDIFDRLSGTCPVEGDGRNDSDGFRIIELEALGFALQRNVGHHVDEQFVELSRCQLHCVLPGLLASLDHWVKRRCHLSRSGDH